MYAWLLSTFTDGKKSIKTRSREEGKKQETRVECGARNQEKVGGRDQQGGTGRGSVPSFDSDPVVWSQENHLPSLANHLLSCKCRSRPPQSLPTVIIQTDEGGRGIVQCIRKPWHIGCWNLREKETDVHPFSSGQHTGLPLSLITKVSSQLSLPYRKT